LETDRRLELIRFNSAESPDRIASSQAALLAWCDSCPDAELETLLDWPQQWAAVLTFYEIDWLPSPEREFWKRCPDRETGRERLIASLLVHEKLARDAEGIRKKASERAAHRILWLLLEDAAHQNPAADKPCDTAEQWIRWFNQVIAQPPFAHLTRSTLGWNSEYMARSFWIWRHGADNWNQLRDYAACEQEERVFDQLAAIVPCDELDCWDGLVLDQAQDHGEMRAYSTWLVPQYTELLRTHFNHPDPDWRACAFQNYLAKTPEPILEHHWRRGAELPLWQLALLDRRLFAPEPIRPAAIVHDIQTVEGDLRLQDPFNHRAF